AAIAVALAFMAGVLYCTSLSGAPRFLIRDEVFSGLTADAISRTGADLQGTRLPVFFKMDPEKYGSPIWFQPILMYAIAGTLKVLPFSEASVRLPTAVAGVISVVLIYLIGLRLFENDYLAVIAAVMFAVTPAQFIYSRVAMDYSTPLPFILGWMLCLLSYLH